MRADERIRASPMGGSECKLVASGIMHDRSEAVRLVVFADDWGRHPSSCQHLVRRLLPRYPTLWVNTIGTRRPSLSVGDVGKIARKLTQWLRPPQRGLSLPHNLTVISPRMYPGFRTPWQRRYNARRISRDVHATLGPRRPNELRIAITTLPITADLVGKLDVDRWVYYCVDDFSVWPGLDSRVLQQMEVELAGKVDEAIAVSQTLRERLAGMGRPSHLLTHGIDAEHWAKASLQPQPGDTHLTDTLKNAANDAVAPVPMMDKANPLPRPIYLFWGLVDTRLNVDWCLRLAESGGTLVLAGPQQSPDLVLGRQPHIVLPGPMDYEQLPALATWADVLVMPYSDLPVTRAMQPLKFKEYLATGRPVVASGLPATREWSDAADVVDSAEAFVEVAKRRALEGVPEEQLQARQRLASESWDSKATQFEAWLLGEPARAGA